MLSRKHSSAKITDMSKEMVLILLGVCIAVLPHLGFPSDIKVILMGVAGIAVAVIGFLLRGETLSRNTDGSESRPIVAQPSLTEPHDQ